MQTNACAARSNNFGGVLKPLAIFIVLVSLPLVIYLIAKRAEVTSYSPFGLFGAPVFAKVAVGERVYLLTGQWRRIRPPGRYNSGYDYTEFYVDMWAVDVASAKTLWRKRLETERGGGYMDREFLGVDGNVIWLVLHKKLVAISASDGSVLAPVGRVEELNPELKGLMPTDSRYIVFDSRGLCITAADARQWRVDLATFKVAEVVPVSQPAKEGAFPPEFISPGSSGLHLVRGLDMTTSWMGLLTDEEAKVFDENNTPPSFPPETRRRIWGARVGVTKGEFSETRDYMEFRSLPESPEFLDSGLLREYTTAQQLPALWVTDPPSVFVLHRERLGQAGKLRLARVSGPLGKVEWEAALPLTNVQSVKKMEKHIVIFGHEYIEGDPDISEALRDSPQRLVSIELATGAVHFHTHSVSETHPEAVKVDVGLE
jgi:hypothetical protein